MNGPCCCCSCYRPVRSVYGTVIFRARQKLLTTRRYLIDAEIGLVRYEISDNSFL